MLQSIKQIKKARGLAGPFYARKMRKTKIAPGVLEIPVGTFVLIGGVSDKLGGGGHIMIVHGEQGIKILPFTYENRKVWEFVPDEISGASEIEIEFLGDNKE
jgi:hypothetical protein